MKLQRILPFHIMALALAFSLAMLAVAVSIHLDTPRLGVTFEISDDGEHVLLTSSTADSNKVEPVSIIRSISAENFAPVAISPSVLLEDPDLLPFAEYNRFMDVQTQIRLILDSSSVRLHLLDGTQIELQPRAISISELPILFWLLSFYGLSAFLISLGIWVFKRHQPETKLLLLIATSFYFGTLVTGLYSTRELALDGKLFTLLSNLSHLSVYMFAAFLMALMWCFPQRLKYSSYATTTAVCSVIVFWILQLIQLVDFHLMFFLLFISICLLMYLQWKASKERPLDHATMQQFLLTIFTAITLFSSIVMIPAALGFQPPVDSQTSMLVLIWLMFIGIAFSVIRYNLFKIGRWWAYMWLWLIGGVVIIAFDLALFSLWSLPQTLALPLTLAIVGWLYFPLRQWLWAKAIPQNRKVEDFLPDLLENFLRVRSEEDILHVWSTLAQTAFSPLIIEHHPAAIQQSEIRDNGLTMLLPCLMENRSLRLEYANQGRRLFTEDDRKLAHALFKLVEHSSRVARAEQKGAHIERERIKRELHDGLGGKIMAMMHSAPEQRDLRPLAKDAWRELREIVSTIQGERRPISEILADWRIETKRITDAMQVQLSWDSELNNHNPQLSPLQALNLRRSLTEGVQNALRHGKPDNIYIQFRLEGKILHLDLKDDGIGFDSTVWKQGSGTHHIINRIEELGGEVEWKACDPQGTQLHIHFPLEENIK